MKLSNLKRALSLIVTVALVAGLVAMPVVASCAEPNVLDAKPTVSTSSGTTRIDQRADGVWAVQASGTSTSRARFSIVPTTAYTIGTVANDAAPTFVKLEYTIKNCKETAQILYNSSYTAMDTLPAGGTVDYKTIVDLQTGKMTIYKNNAGTWTSTYTETKTGSFADIYSLIDEGVAGDPVDYLLVSNLSETVYTGTWSEGAILGVPVIKTPTVTNPGSSTVNVEKRDGGVWAVQSTTSASNPRFNIAASTAYTIGSSSNADPKFVVIDYTMQNCKATNIGLSGGLLEYTLPASATVTYKALVNLETGNVSLYKAANDTWAPVVSATATGTFSVLFGKLSIAGGDSADCILVSNLSETVYYTSVKENQLLYGDKYDIYPTPTVRSGADMTFTGSNGTWVANVTGSGQGGLSLPLVGTATGNLAGLDTTAAYIKTVATIDANQVAGMFSSPEVTINYNREYDPVALVTAYYTTYIDLTAIIDVANDKIYIYTAGMEPVVYNMTTAVDDLTDLRLSWRKNADAVGTINISNYKQTTYYDSNLTIAEVLADGAAAQDTETFKASLYTYTNNSAGIVANATVAKNADAWTVTTNGAEGTNSEVKMISAYYAPKTGFAATATSKTKYADFIHYTATVKVTGGAYESYQIGTVGVSATGTQATIAPVVYGTNGLPKLVEGVEYDIDMIYDVATGKTYAYVNDVLCQIRGLSQTGLDFTGFVLGFNNVTSPVTAVVSNPTFKYYNNSGSATLSSVAAELDNDGFKVNYKTLADGKAKAQFYGNLADECYVIAVYEGDVLKSASKLDFDGLAREIEADVAAGQTAKVFLWNAETLAPVVAPYGF